MADDPRQTAFRQDAPAPERFDAQAELQRAYRPTTSELIPAPEIQRVIDYIREGHEEADLLKSARILRFPGNRRDEDQPTKGMRSVFLDNLQIFAHGDYWDKPSPVGFETLRQMVDQTPILSAVVLTRIRQVSRFCAPQEDDGPGFVIRHLDREHAITASERESLQALMRFMNHCGWEANPRLRKRLRRDTFSRFMAKMVRDSLTMDAAPIETEYKRDASQGLDGLYAVDGATVRLCSDEGYHGDEEVFAVQVTQGRLVTAYTHQDLIYEVRNPRADVRLSGYGLSETELLVRIVTGFLSAMNLNIKGFDENSIPRGMLHLSGDYSQEDLAAFRRYWNAMVKGVQNAWSLPVLVSKDQQSKASFERFGVDWDEMYFSKWMTFLTSIACAIYGMAPDEINFESFAASKSSLSGADTEQKLADSKDKGLRPLMAYFEGLFSDYVLGEFSDKYCFRWTGIDEEDLDKRHELRKLLLTVNEARAQEGYDKLKGPLGDAPINPSLIGPWMQLQQGASEEDGGKAKGTAEGPQGTADDGWDAGDEDDDRASLHKANPHHDDLGRFTFAFGERADLRSRVVPVTQIRSAGDFRSHQKRQVWDAAVRALRSLPSTGLRNLDTGWDLVIGRSDWKKLAQWPAQTLLGLRAIAAIEDLARVAIRAETHEDVHGNPAVVAVHRFYAPATIDGQGVRVKLTVKDYELPDSGRRRNLHALQALEIETPDGIRLAGAIQGTYPPAQPSGDVISVAHLLTGVNRDSDGMLFGTPPLVTKALSHEPWVIEA